MVDRQTRCILGWKLVWERTQESLQDLVDEAPKLHRIQAMGSIFMPFFGITLGAMKSQQAKPKPTRWKLEMLNSDITWLASLEARAVSRAARMP